MTTETAEKKCPMCENATAFWGVPTKCYGGGHATEVGETDSMRYGLGPMADERE